MEDRGAPIEAATASHPKVATSSFGEDSSNATKAGNNPREAQKTPSNTHDSKSGLQKSTHSVEDALKEIDLLTQNGRLSMEHITVTRSILKEHSSLKEKVDKLKSLLGRSAKAQREAKIDLEATQKRLSQSLREIERLNQKLDKLQSRPTHCKLFVLLLVCDAKRLREDVNLIEKIIFAQWIYSWILKRILTRRY